MGWSLTSAFGDGPYVPATVGERCEFGDIVGVRGLSTISVDRYCGQDF